MVTEPETKVVNDKGAWWIEGTELHLNIARLLENFGLPDTEENIGKVVKVALELAADKLPRTPCVVLQQGAGK